MKPLKFILLVVFVSQSLLLCSQVKTNFNNSGINQQTGLFNKAYKTAADFTIAAMDIPALLRKEEQSRPADESKPFYIAEPVKVNLDVAGNIQWIDNGDSSYGQFIITADSALTTSINFDRFFLPEGSEMYVYNRNAEMITGPVTPAENNQSTTWGSWVYKGSDLIIEIRLPATAKSRLRLHADNIAYGYKEVYKVSNFGNAGSCEVNVLCPLGNGWSAERNSVAILLNSRGSAMCSGCMVMNTCSSSKPYFLTADHCFDGNEANWRFTFQAWSANCSPTQNATGTTFNGSALKAHNASTDFCLVELNTTPPAGSGINYAGWSRSTTAATQATGIHHPHGDVMKISRANNSVSIASFAGTTNQHWRADWSAQSNGTTTVTPVTEPGSSGSPLFDQNHRLIGQLHGGPSLCGGTQPWDFYGRFDLSWTGGGTNATRLSNWLDATGTGATTTNTTDISNLVSLISSSYSISGLTQFCTSASYSLSPLPAGAVVSWSVYPSYGLVTSSVSANVLTLNRVGDGTVTVSAVLNFCGSSVYIPVRTVQVGGNPITLTATQTDCDQFHFVATGAAAATSYNWSSMGGTVYYNGTSTTATTSVNYINATTNTFDYAQVSTTNTCAQTVTVDVDYFPYARNVLNLSSTYYPSDQISLSVNTSPYDSYYRWYINSVLVKQGSSASTFCTCTDGYPYSLQCGDNHIYVEVETSCGANSVSNVETFTIECGYYLRAITNVELFPNPARGQVTVRLKQMNETKTEATRLKAIKDIRIMDKTGNLRKLLRYNPDTKSVNINLSSLPYDIYYLEVSDGIHTARLPLGISR
jgi:lysyl endopeptidase